MPGRQPGPAVAPGTIELFVEEGPGAGGSYMITSPQTIIGRGMDCDIVIDDELISSRHARILITRGTVILEDLGSTNGTVVNDREITSCQLTDGDIIEIGDTLHRITYR